MTDLYDAMADLVDAARKAAEATTAAGEVHNPVEWEDFATYLSDTLQHLATAADAAHRHIITLPTTGLVDDGGWLPRTRLHTAAHRFSAARNRLVDADTFVAAAKASFGQIKGGSND